ncbi:MAG TPA: hypothetical protein VK964_18690 [Nocardioidaceae bacterium]|nr:hypothetical protein [Nocardioidaceae bacterium]
MHKPSEATIALLPSPLLGRAAWEPVQERLLALGRPVVVADVPRRPRVPDDVLAAFVSVLAREDEVVLVPHSNAGLYAPALTETVACRATVFVDAALPSSTPSTPLAPPQLMEHLRELADEAGRLPPWTRWWRAADVDHLFPDATWRRRIEAREPRLALSYFTSRVRVPEGWATRPAAYLAFGGTYAHETAVARGHGWPLDVLEGRHLHMLHEPDAVAGRILGLLEQLETRRAYSGP